MCLARHASRAKQNEEISSNDMKVKFAIGKQTIRGLCHSGYRCQVQRCDYAAS